MNTKNTKIDKKTEIKMLSDYLYNVETIGQKIPFDLIDNTKPEELQQVENKLRELLKPEQYKFYSIAFADCSCIKEAFKSSMYHIIYNPCVLEKYTYNNDILELETSIGNYCIKVNDIVFDDNCRNIENLIQILNNSFIERITRNIKLSISQKNGKYFIYLPDYDDETMKNLQLYATHVNKLLFYTDGYYSNYNGFNRYFHIFYYYDQDQNDDLKQYFDFSNDIQPQNCFEYNNKITACELYDNLIRDYSTQACPPSWIIKEELPYIPITNFGVKKIHCINCEEYETKISEMMKELRKSDFKKIGDLKNIFFKKCELVTNPKYEVYTVKDEKKKILENNNINYNHDFDYLLSIEAGLLKKVSEVRTNNIKNIRQEKKTKALEELKGEERRKNIIRKFLCISEDSEIDETKMYLFFGGLRTIEYFGELVRSIHQGGEHLLTMYNKNVLNNIKNYPEDFDRFYQNLHQRMFLEGE